MKDSEWIGTKEAADLLNVSQRTVQNWIDNGKIASTKTLGGHRRIRREDLASLLMPELEPRVAEPSQSRPLSVVLVEDDAFTRRVCELGFQAFSTPYQLFSASNGYEGLRLIGRHQPDLLLTDLKMPGIDGFAMIRELLNTPEGLAMQIVAITSMTADDIKKQGGLPNSVTVLNKPIPFQALAAIFSRRWVDLRLGCPADTNAPGQGAP